MSGTKEPDGVQDLFELFISDIKDNGSSCGITLGYNLIKLLFVYPKMTALKINNTPKTTIQLEVLTCLAGSNI
jgi:hypothetical protein